jgi:sec-independent protein translocase protein TatB
MFDFAWSEIALIGVVALIAIGPKDMPVAIKAVTSAIKKARRMAGEFQTHVDEMVRDADLHEVRSSINEIRNFDFKGTIERNIDPDGALRTTLATNPLASAVTPETPIAAAYTPAPEPEPAIVAPAPEPAEAGPSAVAMADAETRAPPAFIPPEFAVLPPPPPAFIPPGTRAPV